VNIHVWGILEGMVIQLPARAEVSMSDQKDTTLTIGLVIAWVDSRFRRKSQNLLRGWENPPSDRG
jgi:hypothetical protein